MRRDYPEAVGGPARVTSADIRGVGGEEVAAAGWWRGLRNEIIDTGREIRYRLTLPFTAPTLREKHRAEFDAEWARRKKAMEENAAEYAKGYTDGWKECFEACLEAVQEEMGKTERLDI